MLVCGIDFETTGLDHETERVIEIGAALWDTNNYVPLMMQSDFCTNVGFPPLTEEIVGITGITDKMLSDYGIPYQVAFDRLAMHMERADCVLAHNGAQFDKDFATTEFTRIEAFMPQLVWVDSALDFEYPLHIKTRNLNHIACEYGFLNPFKHRALFDVLTMMMNSRKHDMVAALELAKQPWMKLAAINLPFERKDEAKDRGYRWNPDDKTGGPKGTWCKVLREKAAFQEKMDAPFKTLITVVDGKAVAQGV